MKKDRRWLNSILVASEQPMPALPWQRGTPARVQAPQPEGRVRHPAKIADSAQAR